MLKFVSCIVLVCTFSTASLSNNTPKPGPSSVFTQLRQMCHSSIQWVKDNPAQAFCVSLVSIATGYISWTFLRRQIPAGAPLAAAIAHVLNPNPLPQPQQQPPRIVPQPVAHMNEDEMLNSALKESAAIQARLDDLQMHPADLLYQQDVLGTVRLLAHPRDRVLALQAILYNHDQVLVPRRALEDFALMIIEMPLDRAIEEFGRITTRGWSILSLVRGLHILDIEETPHLLDFHTMREMVLCIRDLIQNQPIDSLANALEHLLQDRPFHSFDRLFFNLIKRYYLAMRADAVHLRELIFEEEEACVKLFIEELLGEDFAPIDRAVPHIIEVNPVAHEALSEVGNRLKPESEEELARQHQETPEERLERIRRAREEYYKIK